MVDLGHQLVEETEFNNILTQKTAYPYVNQPIWKIPDGIHQIPEGIHDSLNANFLSKKASIDLIFSAANATIFPLLISTKTSNAM